MGWKRKKYIKTDIEWKCVNIEDFKENQILLQKWEMSKIICKGFNFVFFNHTKINFIIKYIENWML